MQKFNGSLVRQFPSLITGNAAAGVIVTVYTGTTGTNLATLYSGNGTGSLPNPLTTDAAGYYGFYAADGQYRLKYSVAGIPDQLIQLLDAIQVVDEIGAGSGLVGQAASAALQSISSDQQQVEDLTAEAIPAIQNALDVATEAAAQIPEAVKLIGGDWVFYTDINTVPQAGLIEGNRATDLDSGQQFIWAFYEGTSTGFWSPITPNYGAGAHQSLPGRNGPSRHLASDIDMGNSRSLAQTLRVNNAGYVGIGEPNPAGILSVRLENNATAGIRCRAEWTGSTASPYQNNDNTLFETYNNITSDSLNLSWSVSADNSHNNIPAGVTDSGWRVGVLGWATSTNMTGYVHAGTLARQYGVWGRAGFQGGSFQSPAGATVQNAHGIYGQVRCDSVSAKIENAYAGYFEAFNYEAGTVDDSYAVYAIAGGGLNANWSFYGEAGVMYNAEKALFGSKYTESNAYISSRAPRNSIEFGFPDVGYGSNLGATQLNGFPFLSFCAKVDDTGNTFTTSGFAGSVIYNNLAGATIFGVLPSDAQAGQAVEEAFKVNPDASVSFANRIQIAKQAPTTSSSNGVIGSIAWDEDYFFVCVAANTWKRIALTTW